MTTQIATQRISLSLQKEADRLLSAGADADGNILTMGAKRYVMPKGQMQRRMFVLKKAGLLK